MLDVDTQKGCSRRMEDHWKFILFVIQRIPWSLLLFVFVTQTPQFFFHTNLMFESSIWKLSSPVCNCCHSHKPKAFRLKREKNLYAFVIFSLLLSQTMHTPTHFEYISNSNLFCMDVCKEKKVIRFSF